MSLSEKTIVDLIEILDSGHIQVREANIIEKNGVTIAKTFHRYVLAPGDNVSDKEQKIKDIAAVVWTPEVIAKYEGTKEQ